MVLAQIVDVFVLGDYGIQPVFVEGVGEIAINAGHKDENIVIHAVGPEIYTFDEFIYLIAEKVHSRAKIVHVGPGLVLWIGRLIGNAVKDVVITKDEIQGLMSNLLVSESPSTAPTRFSEWLTQNADSIGIKYISELRQHYR